MYSLAERPANSESFFFQVSGYGMQTDSARSNCHFPALSSKRTNAISSPSSELPLINPITLYCMGNDFLIQSLYFSFINGRIPNIGFLIFIYGDKSESALFNPL